MIKCILEKITQYHKGLEELSTRYLSESFKEDLLIYRKVYPDFLDCDDVELKGHLFENMVYTPIRQLFEYMNATRFVSVDMSSLGNEYRIDARQVCEYLRLVGSHGRKLLLNSVSVPSSVYADLSDGILDNNIEALKRAEGKVDLTDFFKHISFLHQIVSLIGEARVSDPVRRIWNNSIIEYTLWESPMFQIEKLETAMGFDVLEEEAKKMLMQYYKTAYRLTEFEKKAVSKLLKSIKEYKDFFSAVYKLCEPDERIFVRIPKYCTINSLSSNNGDIIKGVKGLAKVLGCCPSSAQAILNSKILENNGIANRIGREWRVDKTRLLSFIAQHPNAFVKVSGKRKNG